MFVGWHRRAPRVLGAVLVMLGGSAMVFAMMLLMNERGDTKRSEEPLTVANFDVAPPPPPPPPPTRPAPRREPLRKGPSPAPVARPELGLALSGVGLDFGGLSKAPMQSVGTSILGDVRASVMTEDAVDKRPVVRRRTAATYPARARARGLTGYVTLNLLIDERGAIEQVRVLDAQPAGVFDESALAAVKEWQFSPATYQGQPVRVWARQTIRFELSS